MRFCCVQFNPTLGDVEGNIARADRLLEPVQEEGVRLHVLMAPELAFTGYNFPSLEAITPYLEPTTSGPSTAWAIRTSRRFQCYVTVGYPEITQGSSPVCYNSVVLVRPDGRVFANYRKSFLYCTDQTWAAEGDGGFFAANVPGLGRVGMGICMDINPYRFEAPWTAYEFANHIVTQSCDLVLMTMAWLTSESTACPVERAEEPNLNAVWHWSQRLRPLFHVGGGREVLVVFCNRSGSEGTAHYAGTSAAIGFKDGLATLYARAGEGQEKALVIDTEEGDSYE